MIRQSDGPATEPDKRMDRLLALLLAALAILAYHPVWRAGFIWDDDGHVTKPALRSLAGLGRIWAKFGATQQYYPLLHSAFWVEHGIWGGSAACYHWLNILLNLCSAFLLVKILRQLEIPGAWLAAAIFALHPVEVESVAWVSEQKNTLSGVFYLAAASFYLQFDKTRLKKNYAAAFLLFVCAVTSKTVTASLPAALLLVFWWRRGKLSWKVDVFPLLPFFAMGMLAGLLTALVERTYIGAQGSEFDFSFVERCLIAGRDVWFYLGKLFWPARLSFIYPRWNINQAVWWQYLFPVAALMVVGLFAWRRWRGALVASLFFAGTLFPALGFFNVYPFRFSFVADHFQYLAGLGPIVLVSAWIGKRRALKMLAAGPLIIVLAALTWMQSRYYVNEERLWLRTIHLNPECWMARNNLGLVFAHQRRLGEAIGEFKEAVKIKPDYAEAYDNLGMIYNEQKKWEQAIRMLHTALQYRPRFAEAYYNLGRTYLEEKDLDAAIANFQAALQIKPDYDKAHANLGIALAAQGHLDAAIGQYRQAIAIAPENAFAHNALGAACESRNNLVDAKKEYAAAAAADPEMPDAHRNLGNILAAQGECLAAERELREAVNLDANSASAHYDLGNVLLSQNEIRGASAEFARAVELKPNYLEAQYNLALSLNQLGEPAKALEHGRVVLQLNPRFVPGLEAMAGLLATVPDPKLHDTAEAVRLGTLATQLAPNDPLAWDRQAMALADAGEYRNAAAAEQKALQVTPESNKAMIQEMRGRFQRYQSGKR
jgi:tetratricopeptide (TPR) repeat protein